MTRAQPVVAHDGLRRAIRDVPDFPRPGIMFKDVTPLLGSPALFREGVEAMAEPYRHAGVTHVAAIESRGFLFGAPIALELGAGLVPVRKPGKLPHRTRRAEYELEYGTDALEIHSDALDTSAHVLVVDDVIATGGTARAAGELVRLLGGELAGYSFLIELAFLGGRARLPSDRVAAVLIY